MGHDGGYTDSTTWQAWFDAAAVLWDNTSIIFIFSLVASLVILVVTWFVVSEENLPPTRSHQLKGLVCRTSSQKIVDDSPENETNQRSTDEDESECMDHLLDLANHLPSEMKRAQLRAIERTMENEMTQEQKETEMEMQKMQLEAIARLMQEQQDKFGDTSIEDIKNQMRLYCG